MSYAEWKLIIVAVVGIGLLLWLVIHLRWQPFVALLFVSFAVGLAAGMPVTKVLKSVQDGMASTLGFIAIVVGLGAMLGQMLEVSGGAERMSQSLMKTFGEKYAQWALALTGFLVSIPIFLDVGLVILIPLIYSLSRRTGRSLLYFGIPLLAGLGVSHTMIPPTPGPVAAAEILKADLGLVILYGTLAGIPAAIVAGPLFGTWIAKRIYAAEPSYMRIEAGEKLPSDDEERAPVIARPVSALPAGAAVPMPGTSAPAAPAPGAPEKELPSFTLVVSLILLPIALIVVNTLATLWLLEGNPVRATLVFIGHPFVALLLVTLLAWYSLGTLRGYTRDEIQSIATKALEPAGIIILITGAGGVFKQVLIDSGVGKVLGDALSGTGLPTLLLAFLVAAFIRVAQGSATVAMVTGAGIVLPVLDGLNASEHLRALATIAIACGATVLSHVNDSGFWLVNRFFGLSVKDTLKSWTVMETIVGVVGFGGVVVLSLFIK